MFLTDALVDSGIPAAKLMPGTGGCSVIDAVTLTRHAVQIGAPGVLVLPPFFFKNVSEDGVYAYYSEIVERVGDKQLAIYLHHIPQLTQVPITLSLIERLLKWYSGVIAGGKDSSGDWDNSKSMIEAFANEGFDVFPASESMLSKALPIGGAGCISATVNMNPAGIRALFDGWSGAEGERLQANADVLREIFQARSMIPAMKRVVSEFSHHPQWRIVRPPLTALSDASASELLAELNATGFTMPKYPV